MPNVAAAAIWPLSLASSLRVSVTGSMAAPCHHWKTACVFNGSSLGTECVGYETKASNETRQMAHAARGCPTRSVPACLRPRDWHADRAVHPRPFGHYRRDRDRSSAPIIMSTLLIFIYLRATKESCHLLLQRCVLKCVNAPEMPIR